MNEIINRIQNDFIDTFIPSKDNRNYLHEINHEFSDREKAVIIANHFGLSIEEKKIYLKALLKQTSDEDLKGKINEELVLLEKKEQSEYQDPFSCGALNDYVFIPHDFRHGDIVTIASDLLGQHNEDVITGIILNYYEEDYEFKQKLKGDYSDMQLVVDTRFVNHEYQGEFAHEHINPIYIERAKPLYAWEEAYLKYLTDYYAKSDDELSPDRIEAVLVTLNKAWHKRPDLSLRQLILKEKEVSGLCMEDIWLMDDLYNRYLREEPLDDMEEVLKERYRKTLGPVYDEEYNIWCVNTDHGFETGDAAYVAGEFCQDNAVYPYDQHGQHQHTHSFDGIIEAILNDHENFSIDSYKDAYSDQELRIIDNLLKAYRNIKQ